MSVLQRALGGLRAGRRAPAPAEAPVQLHPPGRLLALLGNPNCGKTALFNQLTGSRQKVANYAGVTVERKEGRVPLDGGRSLRLLDLPGAYSLHPRSPDEQVTRDVLVGQAAGERRPDALLCVVDASNLRRHLRLVLAARRLGLPCLVVLNMADVAEARGLGVDPQALSAQLGLPVVRTVATRGQGLDELRARLPALAGLGPRPAPGAAPEGLPPALGAAPVPDPSRSAEPTTSPPRADDGAGDHAEVQRILAALGLARLAPPGPSDRIDAVVLHPVAGPLVLLAVLFGIFQAVFAWAKWPMERIEQATAWLGAQVGHWLAPGWLHSLLVDGLVAGVGGVLVFLPQILILFFFILLLEESGYLPRAAFLLDRLMGGVGLSGRSFIPLLSSFACAIPGILAARTIGNPRDRLVTILIAPLMTCSARLPVYALLIAAFIPARRVGGLQLQGLVLFGLYLAGIAAAAAVAWVLKRLAGGRQVRTLMMELPNYHWPQPRSLALGLWQRALIFVRRVGGIILLLTLLLWALSSWPQPPDGAAGPAIQHSLAGRLGQALEPLLAPLGFNWQIAIALVPGMAARELVVSALGTVYALAAVGDEATAQALEPLIAQQWPLSTGLALMAWFVFAPQCLSTLAAVKRETGGWRVPALAAAYLFALAYLAAWLTRQVVMALGG